ncbi:hypothetical protein NDA11_001582 [Ustilago hordei]|nr:hypothetical protein NDA10_006929 [Ustilago hordei]KAJ1590668.1 hypothetical protein NDA11_001582 [Ustilago hordei]
MLKPRQTTLQDFLPEDGPYVFPRASHFRSLYHKPSNPSSTLKHKRDDCLHHHLTSTAAFVIPAAPFDPPYGLHVDGLHARAVCDADPSISNTKPVACCVAKSNIITDLKMRNGIVSGYIDDATITQIDGFGIQAAATKDSHAGTACSQVKIWRLNGSADRPVVDQVWDPRKNRAIVLPLLP